MVFLGVPLSFSHKNGAFIQFITNWTQLELPFFEFFRNFAWVLSFLGLSFFRNVQKKAWIYTNETEDIL